MSCKRFKKKEKFSFIVLSEGLTLFGILPDEHKRNNYEACLQPQHRRMDNLLNDIECMEDLIFVIPFQMCLQRENHPSD